MQQPTSSAPALTGTAPAQPPDMHMPAYNPGGGYTGNDGYNACEGYNLNYENNAVGGYAGNDGYNAGGQSAPNN